MLFFISLGVTVVYGILLVGCAMTACKYYVQAHRIVDKYNTMFEHYMRQVAIYLMLIVWITVGYILVSIAAMDTWGLPL